MAKYIPIPFAQNGLKENIPTNTTLNGSVSLEQGWGTDYEIDPLADPANAKFPELRVFNELNNIITSNIQEWQQQTFPDWIADKGDGLPFAYPKNALVKYTDGDTYVSKIDNNTAIPTDANSWVDFEDFGGSDRIGLIDYGFIAKPYHIVAFGGEFNRADYPKLWAYLEANPSLVKTQAQWTTEATANDGICGYFSSGNGTTTFRVPNLDKAFLRPDSRTIASYQNDEFKSHIHNYNLYRNVGSITTDVTRTANTDSSISITNNNVTLSAGGIETRPKNIAVLPLIVAK